jgi:hypothetical protein
LGVQVNRGQAETNTESNREHDSSFSHGVPLSSENGA